MLEKYFKSFRRFSLLREALEFRNNDKNQEPAIKYSNKRIQKLSELVSKLDKMSMEAHESGNHKRAEDLDALFAQKQEELENILSELEGEHSESSVEDEKFVNFDQNEMENELGILYYKFINTLPVQGLVLNRQEFLELLRGIEQHYNWGPQKREVSDEELIEAAKDSFENSPYFKAFRRKNPEEFSIR